MKDIIQKYLQETATEAEKRELLAWLREKEENRQLFFEIRDEWLGDPAFVKFGADYVKNAFKSFVNEVRSREREAKRARFRSYYRVAAVIALLIICSIGTYWAGGRTGIETKENEKVVTVVNRVIMGKESKGSFILPDGSKVWLNANSQLVYPEDFVSDTRTVKLQGEGYFEVAKNEKIPFVVETDGMQIRVLGTHFNVKNYGHQRGMETALLTGKVEILFPEMTTSILLKPDQKIFRDRETGKYKLSDVVASHYAIWIGDKLVCNNEKLSAILHKMKHWYNMEIECKPGVPLNQRLSLTIRKESPEEIFKLLTLISPIRYRLEKDKIIVTPK